MEFVDEAAEKYRPEDGGRICEGDGERGGKVREAEGLRVGGEVDIWDEEAEALEDISDFEDPESGGAQEAEGEGAALSAWAEGETGFNEDQERAGENNEDDGPGAEHGSEAVFVEAPVHDEGDDDTAHACAGPHDAEGEAFAADEPFV